MNLPGVCKTTGWIISWGYRLRGGHCSLAWSWGVNLGFTVLGSMLAFSFAQFSGFNASLLLAGACYLVATMAFKKMAR